MHAKNILVIGEAIDDFFCYAEVNRFDPAGPWPVLNPIKTIKNAGGAGNVVSNLISLAGEEKRNVLFLRPFDTITKTRYVCEKTNHCFIRVDENDRLKETLHSREQFFNYCNFYNINWPKLEAILISDYGKNFLTKNFIGEMAGLAKLHNIPVFLDTKFDLGLWSKEIFCVKINEKEYLSSDQKNVNPERFCENLIVTLGENGAVWKNKQKTFPLEKQIEVVERSGLGDVFFAALVTNYLENNDLERAITWANKVCSFKATKKGIQPVNRKEIID